ncbi:hypothetical protein [Achromobacter aloeverae]|uniref:hypothetical protein n=1 Tax=Achromobacter aloeverae TaxID=1750518 RepID=UPI00100ED5AC|nr:hypothetical protein [Achromobacter aloeverae]
MIDFLDRREEMAGVWVASRARVVADLEGFVGRNAVDEALEDLVARGWLRRKNHVEQGPTNLVRRAEFALDADAIAESLCKRKNSPEPGDPKSRNREIGFPDSGTERGPETGTPYRGREQKKTTTCDNAGDAPGGAGGGIQIAPDYLAELVEAGVAAAGQINKPVAFKRAIRLRILRHGPNPDDLAALSEYRRRRDVATKQATQAEANRLRDQQALTPDAREHGKQQLAAIRAQLGKRIHP